MTPSACTRTITRARGDARPSRAIAMQLVAPGRYEPVERPLPRLTPNGVLIQLEGCGVCASNVPVWEGRPWFKYPLEPGMPGHEGWGEAIAVGSEVAHVQVGDRVATLSDCAFAEYVVADADQVAVIPSSLAGIPVPGEPLACALNVFQRSGIESGMTVGVVGVGFLGALLVQLATSVGATVFAASRRPFAQQLAVDMGARRAFGLSASSEMVDAVRQHASDLCDVVIEAGGVQQTLDFASATVRTRGRLVIAGYHQDGARTVNMQQWNWHGIDVINAHERDPAMYVRGMREAFEAMRGGVIAPDALYTHTFALEDINKALQLAHERPDGFVKAIVRPHVTEESMT